MTLPLTRQEVAAHPRMVALSAQIADERIAQEAHWVHRVAALTATLQEEHHRATTGHVHVAGERGLCAVCEGLIHPEQV